MMPYMDHTDQEIDDVKDAIRDILSAFEDKVFVRSIEGDGSPGWLLKLIRPVRALAVLQRFVEP
jgi:hypothetical protein